MISFSLNPKGNQPQSLAIFLANPTKEEFSTSSTIHTPSFFGDSDLSCEPVPVKTFQPESRFGLIDEHDQLVPQVIIVLHSSVIYIGRSGG